MGNSINEHRVASLAERISKALNVKGASVGEVSEALARALNRRGDIGLFIAEQALDRLREDDMEADRIDMVATLKAMRAAAGQAEG